MADTFYKPGIPIPAWGWQDNAALNAICAPYDESTPYSTGDFAIYQGKLYKAIANTTGEFDLNDWNETTVMENI